MNLRRYILLALALVAWTGFDRYLKKRTEPTRTDLTDRDIAQELRTPSDDLDVVAPVAADAPAGAFLGDPAEISTVGLVAAETELLTVDGADHRRRDQTAGPAARELAAAQVRARRYGSNDEM